MKLLSVAGLIFSTLVCSGQVKSSAYRAMLKNLLNHTVPEVQVQQVAKDSSAILFLDAREPKEFDISHIKDAVNVGYDHFDISRLSGIPKDKHIIVYCSVGYRSEKIGEKLLAAGFKDVSNLYGGIFEWVNQDQPVFDEKGQTKQVHAYDRTWGVWLKKGEKVY